MSGSNPSTLAAYVSPIDFRIGQTPPVVRDINDAQIAIVDLYAFAQQVIRTFVDTVGIGPQTVAKQIALDGNPTTITGGDQNRFYCTASEDIQPGMAVHFFDNGSGLLRARRATAVVGNAAEAFCSNPKVIPAGEVGEFLVLCGVIRLNGLIMGSPYYASLTPGLISNTPPSPPGGTLLQVVGWAVDTQHLVFNLGSFTAQ